MEKLSKAGEIAYTVTPQQLALSLNTDLTTGLTAEEANARLLHFGQNQLDHKEPESIYHKIKEQFEDILVRILLISAIVSLVIAILDKSSEEGIAAYLEPVVIFLILILNATVGVLQDLKAEKALDSLKQLQSTHAQVIRNGAILQIDAINLVLGDLVRVKTGDKVPADLRLVSLTGKVLLTKEGSLTGESHDIDKNTEAITSDKHQIQDKHNCLFSSTSVVKGSGLGIVIATGMKTELGKIHSSVMKAQDEEEATPLQKELEQFGTLLSKIIGCICAVVWIANIHNFFDPAHGTALRGAIFYFKMAIALAVAAIPEGLPAVITTCLALGTIKMAKENAIVTKLSSVETLGCTAVICTDKTGTLTKNEMVAISLISASEDKARSCKIDDISASNAALIMSSHIAGLCNQCNVEYKGQSIILHGSPTEKAIVQASERICQKIGEKKSEKHNLDVQRESYQVLGTFEFDNIRKRSSVIVRKNEETQLFTLGAADMILKSCSQILLEDGSVVEFSSKLKSLVIDELTQFENKAMRCLALQYKKTGIDLITACKNSAMAQDVVNDEKAYEAYESQGIFVSAIGIADPLRLEVPNSIRLCQKAGIEVIMITGDNSHTAFSIAKEANICQDKENAIDAHEFNKLDDDQKIGFLKRKGGKIFARVEPQHKQEIVKLLKRLDFIVAMTGDGVNDAPALSQADIGIAMGITGTNVAKEASKLILSDDNFSTIVSAIRMGRSIYDNMKAFIRYLISSNIGEVIAIFSTAILCIPESLSSVQLLWVNLVTDGLPATALGFNPPEEGIMEKPPRKLSDKIINKWILIRYLIVGTYIGLATIGIFIYWFIFADTGDKHPLVSWSELSNWSECQNWEAFTQGKLDFSFGGNDFKGKNACDYFTEGKAIPSTMSLSVLVLIEMLNALNAISENGSLLTNPPWRNPWLILAIVGSMFSHCLLLYIPWLRNAFNLSALGVVEWTLVILFSVPVIFIDEFLKFLTRRRMKMKIMLANECKLKCD